MRTIYKNFEKRIQRYLKNTSGAIAVAFAIMAPVVIGAAGMALDLSQAYLVQQRLSQALDAAALAGAASSTDPATIEQRVLDFFNSNYPPEKLGVTFTPDVQVYGNQVVVSGSATYYTFFLTLIGIDDIDVAAETTVQREVQGLEVALVLDNTGSMSSNNNIDKLKDAVRGDPNDPDIKGFIDILFDSTSNPEYIRIGMVPYSNSVRVGRYGLGLNPDGTDYDGEPFVTLPEGVSYTDNRSSTTGWYGCVVEHESDNYSASATHVENSYGQLWRNGNSWNGHGWNPALINNDPYPNDTLDEYEGPWDIYMFGRVISEGSRCKDIGSGYSTSRCSSCYSSTYNPSTYRDKCNTTYCACRHSNTQQGCPTATVMPLSSDRDALKAHVDTMGTDGNTLGNIGMAWGARLISPEPPFEEAHDWDDLNWRKAIIMMTDGDNTENGTYSAFWYTNRNNMTVTKFNQRFEETCEMLKDKGVIIYTITFASGINSTTKGYYERCASSTAHYHDAPTQDDLVDVFETIARELSNLHIKS
jgi:Flp pilus assembly protein TadG